MRAALARRRGVVLGGRVTIGRGVRFDVRDGGRVLLGGGARVGAGCRFHVPGGEVVLGPGAVLGDRCAIVAHERVVVGARSVLADEVVLADADPRFEDIERPVRLQGLVVTPVLVGDGARLGPGAVVLRGAHVPAGAVVDAHAVVRRPARPASAAAGPRPAAPSPP